MALKMWLVSLMSSLPVIAVLITGLVTCWMQRRRRPLVARILAVVMAFQLAMSLGLSLAFRQILMFAHSQLVDQTANDDWTRPLFYLLPFSCLAAVIWGVAFSAVLFLNDEAEE